MTTKTLSMQPNGIPHIQVQEDAGMLWIQKLLINGTIHDEVFLDEEAAVALRDWLNEVL